MRIISAFVLSFAAGVAGAGVLRDSSLFDAGAVRGSFLSRGVGARAAGMGEAFVAVADDATAVSWNPGGLGQLEALNVCAMYDAAGAGMGLTYAAAAMPTGPGVGGLAVTALNYGSYDGRDDAGNPEPGEGLMDFCLTASYAYSDHPWFGVGTHTGMSVALIREAIGGTLLALSAGALVPVTGELNAGLAVRHLGPPRDGFNLPACVQAGVAYDHDVEKGGVRLACDLSYGLADRLAAAAFGAEAFLNPVTVLRAGYKHFLKDQGFDGANGVTAGLGVRIGSFGLDYAYQPFGHLARSHRFSLAYAGKEY